jgi:hypothetical protein
MKQKKLEKGSVWEKADTNGDGVVSDQEMAMRERMVLLENRDKKEDQQRYLVWFSALTVTAFIVVQKEELKMTERAKKVIKKVASKLTKASQAHAGQAKALKAIELKGGGRTKKKSKSRVNEAGNYTKPEMRKRLFNKIKAGSKGGKPGQWSARKAQLLASEYKKKGGGYR